MKIVKLDYTVKDSILLTKKYVEMYLLLNDIKLADLSITILTYLIIYGINEKAYDFLLNLKIVKSEGTISNNLTLFRKHNLIIKNKNGWEVNKDLNLETLTEVGIMLRFKVNSELNKKK